MTAENQPGPSPDKPVPRVPVPVKPPGGGATRLAADVPLLLLPARIETRFAAAGSVLGGRERGPSLLLRVYPDTISVSSFEAELTQAEITAGEAYWDQLWQAGSPPPNQDAAQAPWRVLAAAFGPTRAAWIALQLTPANLAAQPTAPTSAGQTPSPAPQFPTPPVRLSSYEQAPTAQALPDFWTVALYNGSSVRQVTGGAVTQNLAVGLTPHDGQLPDGLPVDAGMRSLVDFDTAVTAGMALRIQLTEEEAATGFDRIIVYGLRDASTDTPGDAALTALLNAHHYTDGLSFVPQGAPTNNTLDASSAFSSKDPDYAVSFAVERSAALTTAADGDGARTARLLGIPTSTFDHVRYADGYGVRNGQDMLTALWPSTLGYFMEQLMAAQFSANAADTARTYALANAVPRGPLPALRVGKTPYGILPATSLAIAAQQAPPPSLLAVPDPQAALAGFLARLLPAWIASVAGAPHVGGSGDPDLDLAQVLGMDASSVDFRGRQVIGDVLMWNLLAFLGAGNATQEWWLEHLIRGRALLDSLGLTSWDPRIIHTSMGRDSYRVPYPTVQDAPLSETDPLANDALVVSEPITIFHDENYIQWLATAPAADVWAESYPGPKPTSILYRALRQSVLREYVRLAGRAQAETGLLPLAALREPEIVNVDQSRPSITPLDIISRPVAAGSQQTWAQYLDQLRPTPQSPFAPLGALRDSLDRLAGLPTAELDRLLTETLDACSHRLDVWITALATEILQAQRTTPPDGASAGTPTLHLGGYAWVEEVRPTAPAPVVTGSDAKAVERLDASRAGLLAKGIVLAPVGQPDSDNGGFIHAPSMTQAAVGAVLRSGYLSHRGTPGEQTLAIDLSSERVRDALWLLAGVRQGQSLGALTGYQFEQGLHDQQLDVYIQPFRDAYPLISTDLTPQSAAGPVTAPSQVVDGVALHTAWQAGALPAGGYWGTGLPLPSPPGNATQNAVLGLLSQIDDMLGALSDTSMAESVFQIMRGNFGRAGGILDAISRGDHPPDPDLPVTPRAGIDVTHRLMLLLAAAPTVPPDWAGITTHPRALAEPWLSAWVAGRLPNPAIVRCLISWTSGGQPHSATVALRDLDIGPLDVLALADASDQPQRAELENRLLFAANPPADAQTITIAYAQAGLPAGSVMFPDLLTAAQAVRNLIGGARALDITSFSLPENNAATGGGTVDLAELNGRVAALAAQLQTDITALQTAIANIAAAPQTVNAALLAASGYGISGSVPLPNQQRAALAAQATRVLAQLTQRATAAQGTPLPAPTPEAALAVAQTILGTDLPVLPHLVPPGLAAVQSAFTQSNAMNAVDPQATRRWLLQLSHIRPACYRLDFATTTTQLLGAARPALTLAQLPATPGDRWLGLPLDPANPPASGRVAIEAIATGDPATAGEYAGLLLDEWIDQIPSPQTSTGVSFHYNEPKARAPQTLVLATCPDGREAWDTTLVRTILEETLTLAKVRAVDLGSIQEVGQILPALCFPFNLQATTPATDLLTPRETGIGNVTDIASGQG